MSSLSQAPRLEGLSPSHGAFQEHAAHPAKWSAELSSKGSWDACTSHGVSTFLHCAFTAHGLLEVAATAGAMQLAPGATVGVTVGAEIAEPHPALIRTVRIRAEMLRGIHLARPSPRGHDAGWRATGWLGYVLVGLLTGGTRGPAGEARKRLQVTGALGRCRGRPGRCGASGGAVGGPHHVEHETQPHKADEQQLVEKRVWHHGIAPSHRW